jgi:hypothetical protein
MLASNTAIVTSPKLTTADFFTLLVSFTQSGAVMTGGTVSVSNTATPTTAYTVTVDTSWLSLTVRQSQFIKISLFIDNVDVSLYLVNRLEIHWPDDGNGQCTFSLITQNPFSITSPFNIESGVDVFAVYTNPDTDISISVRMFKGKISHFEYVPEQDTASITVQDMSRAVSRETDKLNADILGTDPIVSEKRACTSFNIISTSQAMDMTSPNPLIGIWLESDTSLKVNLTALMNYTFDSSTQIRSFNGGILNAGSNYYLKYQVPLANFIIPNLTKSQVLQTIANIAGIGSLYNERMGQFEDEVVGVNITANDELPLDLMRKIAVPQTWKIEFDEFGTLHVRREYLKATEDFLLDGDRVIEDTLTIGKDTDGVINDITVVGIIKRTGGSTYAVASV